MKAIEINGQIKKFSSLPKVWKNYTNFQNASTELQQQEGFFDVVVPDYTSGIQELGDLYFDEENNYYTYEVVDLDLDIDEEKENKINRVKQKANTLLGETDWYVIRKTERDVDIPDDIETERAAIITWCDACEAEITAFETISEVINYEIDYSGI